LIVDGADLYTARSGGVFGPGEEIRGGGDADVEAGRHVTVPVEPGQCGSRAIDGDRWER
jgi:hypothetical protein